MNICLYNCRNWRPNMSCLQR